MEKRIEKLYQQIENEIAGKGYYLNPDREFVNMLLKGLLENQDRYGYQSCPCRLSVGKKEDDMDLICPCDYRDDDLAEYGACYCALYVDEEVFAGTKSVRSIPERRRKKAVSNLVDAKLSDQGLAYPVYRCKVCGYLMAKDQPPKRCPICGVDQERFERFI
ncbi:ferredoxin:glutaredoxin reductase [Clostridia bacterium]|nr:ferredoxin:glutaredoxin reductase [Clostridia bacterium]